MSSRNTAYKVQQEIPAQAISDALTNGLEGGTGYWATIDNANGPDYHPEKCDQIARGRGFLYIIERGSDEGGEDVRHKLDRAALERGVGLMAKDHPSTFGEMISEDGGDATTGDILVQLALLGEVRYG